MNNKINSIRSIININKKSYKGVRREFFIECFDFIYSNIFFSKKKFHIKTNNSTYWIKYSNENFI